MLSIQQLERLSSIIIYAEKIRNENGQKFPGSEFSLGYYVGSADDDFPDYYYKQKKKLYEAGDFKKVTVPAPPSKIISRCPLCHDQDRGVVRLVDDVKKQRVLHVCDKDPSHVFFIYLSIGKYSEIDLPLLYRQLINGLAYLNKDGPEPYWVVKEVNATRVMDSFHAETGVKITQMKKNMANINAMRSANQSRTVGVRFSRFKMSCIF